MCQLTYCNLHDAYYNSLMGYLLAYIGSERHDDGCGIICSDNKIWKSKFAARKVVNLGEIFYEKFADEKPVPLHIRKATYGIEVNDENAHPFRGKHYLLMHNGTLVPKDGEEPKDKKKDSDSEKFLKALDKATDEKPDDSFESIFNATMQQFSGKFAFIIRNIDTNTDNIVRGKTAELWISHLTIDKKKSGYVINTSKETMLDSFKLFKNIASLIDGKEYILTEPLLLAQETIFAAGKETIKEIGKTKETVVIKPIVEIDYAVNRMLNKAKAKDESPELVQKLILLAERIYEYLEEHSMELIDLQLIFQAIAGISLLEVTLEDLVMFREYLLPKITASNNIRKRIHELLDGKPFPKELYKLHDLEYPWPLNDGVKVEEYLKKFLAA